MIQRLFNQMKSRQVVVVLLVVGLGCQPNQPTIPPVVRPSVQSPVRPAAEADRAADSALAADSMLAAGNARASTDRSAQGSSAQPRTPEPDLAGDADWLSPQAQLPITYWEALYRNAQRIGVTRYDIQSLGGNRDRLRLTMTTSLPLLNVQKPSSRMIKVETLEQSNGNLDTLIESSQVGQSQVSAVRGSVTSGVLQLGSKRIVWPDGSWGPLGIHQLLRRRPLQPGELRVANVFLSQFHQMARITLVAGQLEDTTYPGGLLQRMLPIEVLMQTEKEGIRVRLWADQAGQVHKTIWPEGHNFSSFRVSAAEGQRMFSQTEAQVLAGQTIELADPATGNQATGSQAGKLAEQVAALERVTYKVDSSQADPHLQFSNQGYQRSKSVSAFSARVMVAHPQRVAPVAESRSGEGPAAPAPECLASGQWITAGDPTIAELASHMVGTERAPATVTARLLEGVHQRLKLKPYAVEFRPASDVARAGEGDMTDCAVLLTALLRSRGIAARLVSGLKLQTENGQHHFAFHLWTEAWLDNRWLPVDASTGQVAGCGYIKFLESPLDQSDPFEIVLPVLKAMDQLKITLEK